MKKIRLGLKDVFTFGKHKDHVVEDVISEDAEYVRWAMRTIEWFSLKKDAQEFLDSCEDFENEELP
jgi:hypothetical protein